MTNLLVTVNLKATSGVSEDDVQNSFAVAVPDTWDEGLDLLDLTGPIAAFYNAGQSNGHSVGESIGPSISRAASAHTISVYDVTAHLNGSPHGSPIAVDATTLLPVAAASELPREVAVVLTLRGVDWEEQPIERPDGPDSDSAPDRMRARHTGRLYIGPLANDAGVVAMVGGQARPVGQFTTTLRLAAEKLHDDLVASGFLGWCVWSRKDAAFYELVNVETDDAFDTQRRRGADPTGRTSLYVGP